MKIKQTIERDCCGPDDLRKYQGTPLPGFTPWNRLSVCVHCGQLWQWERQPGEMDAGWERVKALEAQSS